MRFRKTFSLALFLIASFSGASITAAESKQKPNVLLIIADDLNDWIGPLGGHPQAKTPNLDKLAARGLTFHNAYITAPICNPSRASFLTGRRPFTTGIYNNQQPAMPHVPARVPIHDYLREHNYTSLAVGKIYHYRAYRKEHWDDVAYFTDDTLPNSQATRRPPPFPYRTFTENEPTEPFSEKRAESELVDAKGAAWAINQLNIPRNNPFFLAYGVHRPHTPWDVPQKYFDLYPAADSIQLPPAKENDLADVPAAGVKFAHPKDPHAKILQQNIWKDRVRAYLAAISYADAQIGRVLDALEKSPHRDNTIIIFVSDHGWHLGEKEHWAKQALWRQATRVPYIWVVPGMTKPGSKSDRPVDTLSLYPTLCDLLGVPTPKHAEGANIKPLLQNPTAPWNTPALTTHLKGNHAITTDTWRYIRYADATEELYNLKTDPNEWTNLANKPEHAQLKKELAAFMPKIESEANPVAEREQPQQQRPVRRNRRAAQTQNQK